MSRALLRILSLCSALLSACTALCSGPAERSARALLTIGDSSAAVDILRTALSAEPSDVALWKLLLRAQACEGKSEENLIALWLLMDAKFPVQAREDDLIETLCWGIISFYSSSTAPQQRLLAVLAASLSHDARSIDYLLRGFEDSNSIIRGASAQIAAQLRDAPLTDGIFKAIYKEKNKEVRRQFLRTIGSQKLRAAEPMLWEIINDPKAALEEKSIAIEAFVGLRDSVDRRALQRLTSSDRAALRLLACRAIAYEENGNADLIVPLIDDPQGVVRTGALQALAILRTPHLEEKAARHLADPEVDAAVAAAWLLLLQGDRRGESALRSALGSSSIRQRSSASAAIVSSGRHGVMLAKELLSQSKDPFVKINLAIALIGQRTAMSQAGEALAESLTAKGLWTWQQHGCCRAIALNTHGQGGAIIDGIVSSATLVDQLTRLELLGLLTAIENPKALESIRAFLASHSWGITATAAAQLLSEGEEHMLGHVRSLLQDPDTRIAVQAAIVLALWGHDEAAMSTLEKAYPQANRELKEHILEAMGAVAMRPAIPFLLTCLKEPFSSLRLMSAAAILQALYR